MRSRPTTGAVRAIFLPLLAAGLLACGGDAPAETGAAADSTYPIEPGNPARAAGDSILAGMEPGGDSVIAFGAPGEAGQVGQAVQAGEGVRAAETPATGAASRPVPATPAAERPGGSAETRSASGSASTSEPNPSRGQSAAVEEILRATARRYEGITALQADFQQRLTNTLLGRTTESAGTLYQRQPDRFLMRFSQPQGDVIVSDGRYFWIYYPSADPNQVIRSERGAGGLDLRSQFVGDPVRRFETTSHGTETVRGRTTHVLTLTPRENMGYRRLKVWIDGEDHLVRRFELTEENGNVRRFDLMDLRVNPSLPDDLFRFEPPAGAVVVTR